MARSVRAMQAEVQESKELHKQTEQAESVSREQAKASSSIEPAAAISNQMRLAAKRALSARVNQNLPAPLRMRDEDLWSSDLSVEISNSSRVPVFPGYTDLTLVISSNESRALQETQGQSTSHSDPRSLNASIGGSHEGPRELVNGPARRPPASVLVAVPAAARGGDFLQVEVPGFGQHLPVRLSPGVTGAGQALDVVSDIMVPHMGPQAASNAIFASGSDMFRGNYSETHQRFSVADFRPAAPLPRVMAHTFNDEALQYAASDGRHTYNYTSPAALAGSDPRTTDHQSRAPRLPQSQSHTEPDFAPPHLHPAPDQGRFGGESHV